MYDDDFGVWKLRNIKKIKINYKIIRLVNYKYYACYEYVHIFVCSNGL